MTYYDTYLQTKSMGRRPLSHQSVFALILFSARTMTSAIVLLEDLSTPCFLIDLQALQKTLGRPGEAPIPPIALPLSSRKLIPRTDRYQSTPCPHRFNPDLEPIDIFSSGTRSTSSHPATGISNASGDVCYGFIHSRVVRSRQDKRDGDGPTFLVELDTTSNDTPGGAHLVLGLNNHHVVSYYWARSAGAGAAMETPGILFDGSSLQWESRAGFTDCNSNDGKRSEWVNFLRVGENVQLRPHNPEAILMNNAFDKKIYGVSALGRPLGCEPVVVCEWELL